MENKSQTPAGTAVESPVFGNHAPEAPSLDTSSAGFRSYGPRRYFRCCRLEATLSLHQCRLNRVKLSYHDALLRGIDPLPPDIQPFSCWSCSLAPEVEAGALPFYTVEEVLQGLPTSQGASPRRLSSPESGAGGQAFQLVC
ncbi:MAG: hypothetical protein OEZ59_12675 [Deltaproteobacteria bacterium]|nr:hypothetical protein [Deltaproteobacteria bacterium]